MVKASAARPLDRANWVKLGILQTARTGKQTNGSKQVVFDIIDGMPVAARR
jgi:hypothetical protein